MRTPWSAHRTGLERGRSPWCRSRSSDHAPRGGAPRIVTYDRRRASDLSLVEHRKATMTQPEISATTRHDDVQLLPAAELPVPVAGPWITEREIEAVAEAARNAWYADAGAETRLRGGVRHLLRAPPRAGAAILHVGAAPRTGRGRRRTRRRGGRPRRHVDRDVGADHVRRRDARLRRRRSDHVVHHRRRRSRPRSPTARTRWSSSTSTVACPTWTPSPRSATVTASR